MNKTEGSLAHGKLSDPPEISSENNFESVLQLGLFHISMYVLFLTEFCNEWARQDL